MGIRSTLRRLFRRENGSVDTTSGTSASSPRGGGYMWPAYSGTAALQVATVYRCVQLLSESVASLPLQKMKLRGSVFTEEFDRMSYLLNVEPCPTLGAFDFWRQTVQRILLDGNAYIIPVYSNVRPEVSHFVLCGRGTVSHDTINDKYTVHDEQNGLHGVFDEEEVIHIKGMTWTNPKNGVSVLTFARLTLDIASEGDGETYNRFKNGGNVHGIVSNDTSVKGFGEYQDTELEKSAEEVDDKFRTGKRIVSLPGQVDFKQISLSSTDMQFLESRKFTVREICRFFGVHPSFVFDDTSNNYKSAEMANVAFLSHTLDPILRNIENELQRKILPESSYTKRKITFDRKGLYASDLDSRVKYQAATIAAGIYTVNEWRREENKLPVEGGDKVLVSANLKSIDDPGFMQTQAGGKEKKDDDENKQEQE